MQQNLNKRIHNLYLQDSLFAWFDVLLLWATVIFVLFFVLQIVDSTSIQVVLCIASGSLLIFNTASVSAMTKHYAKDKHYIYDLDIKHKDANKANRKKRKVANN